MKTKDDIIQKGNELIATVHVAEKLKLSTAKKLALTFGFKMVELSRTILLLLDAKALTEAHTIGRLLFEHTFNFGALLHQEEHHEKLVDHATGEPGRHMKKMFLDPSIEAILTPENFKSASAYLQHPDRATDSKIGLNWEQIAAAGKTDCLYGAYTHYSFLYAHSNLASLMKQATDEEIAHLCENVWTALELSRLLLRVNVFSTSSREK